MSLIEQRLGEIKQELAAAAQAAGRDAASVKLIAVSKTQSIDAVRTALGAGQRAFGENRVQEAQSKFAGLRSEYPDLELYLIGPLQTNKAEAAVRLFDVIQTLDRPNLADALAKAIVKTGHTPRFCIEVNIGQEPQKSGIAPDQLGEFLNYCRKLGLQVEGLMCIPPQDQDPAPHFRALRDLAAPHGLKLLSMGMSGDFATAIACGATEVRIGTAIFGKREKII